MKINILPKVNQTWSIAEIASQAVPLSWKEVFDNLSDELKHISEKLDTQNVFGNYYPLKENIFSAFRYTKLKDVKVIIMDYEPINDMVMINNKLVPKDVGLAFSLSPMDRDLTPSLNMIYKELHRSVSTFEIPEHGNLIKWAFQGVLLLHSSLTTSPNTSHAQYELWHPFIQTILKSIQSHNSACAVMLWGRKIQSVSSLIPNSFQLFEAGSPAEYQAEDTFIGCDHFNKVNQLLVKQGRAPINWSL